MVYRVNSWTGKEATQRNLSQTNKKGERGGEDSSTKQDIEVDWIGV